jgi:hypothetical protein
VDPEVHLLQRRARGRLHLEAELVTWDQTILRVIHPARSFFVAVPRPSGRRFLEAWAAGRLDAPLGAYAALPSGQRAAQLDVAVPGLFDVIEPPALAYERMERAKPGPTGGRPKRPILALPLGDRPPVPLLIPPGQAPPGNQPPPAWQPPSTVPPVVPPPVQGPPPGQQVPPPPQQVPPPGRQIPPGQQVPPPGRQIPPPPGVPPTGTTRTPRWPIWGGIVVLVTVVIIWAGVPFLTAFLGDETPTQSAGVVPPSQSSCLGNVPCASFAATSGPVASPVPSGCIPGVPCQSPVEPPTTAPTPTPTKRPTPRPTVVPTPKPDTTGPRITALSWTPDVIGVPLPQLQSCGPNSGLGQTVKISVNVTDPAGVRSVALRYQRQGDASPVSTPMTLAGGVYSVTLSTANGPANWYPAPNQQSYVVQLGVRAVDRRGNATVAGLRPGFTVTWCQ